MTWVGFFIMLALYLVLKIPFIMDIYSGHYTCLGLVFKVQCSAFSEQFEVCSVPCEVCSVKFAVFSVQCVVLCVKYQVFRIQCAVDPVHGFANFESKPASTSYIFHGFQKLKLVSSRTSLLRRLQAQTLPHATPPIGKIHPFSKIAIAFEPVM